VKEEEFGTSHVPLGAGKQSKDCRAVGDSAILQDCAGSKEVGRVDGASQGHPEGRVDGEFVRVHWEPTVGIRVG
jgi:hypothetical protein